MRRLYLETGESKKLKRKDRVKGLLKTLKELLINQHLLEFLSLERVVYLII